MSVEACFLVVVEVLTSKFILVLVPIFELDMNLQDEPNAIDESPRRPPVERSRSSDVFDSVARPRVWKRQSSQTSPGHGLSTSVSRPGFIGSLPADAQLAKLAIGPHSILEKENGGSSSVDWKEAAREQVRDEDEKYAEIERLAGLEEEESSPGDSGTSSYDPKDLEAYLIGSIP